MSGGDKFIIAPPLLIFYINIYSFSIQNIYSIDYLENFFQKSDLNECQMAFKYDDLNDTNEVKLVSKIKKKDGFFEKFFNLFSK